MPRKSRKNVGLIGLGIIGTRVAATLRSSGCHVFVWSRTPKAVPNFLGSASEVAEICEVIQLFVSDAQAVIDTIESIGDVLTSNHIIVNCATIGPEATMEAARLVQEKGATYLDCPFTGSKIAAEKGQLCYYVGGDDAAFQRVKPILEATSRAIVKCGKVGDAATLKVATNLITAVTTQTLAEALAIVQKSGIAPEVFAAAIEQNACKSGVIELKLPKMVRGDFDPHFSLKHMFKDVQLGIHIANNFDLEVPVTTVTAGVMYGALNNGWADLDFSSIFRIYGENRQPEQKLAALPEGVAEPEQLEDVVPPKPADAVEAQVVESTATPTAEPSAEPAAPVQAPELDKPAAESEKLAPAAEIAKPSAPAEKKEIPEFVIGDIFKRRSSETSPAAFPKVDESKIIELEVQPIASSAEKKDPPPFNAFSRKSDDAEDIPQVIFGRALPPTEKKEEPAEVDSTKPAAHDEAALSDLERTVPAPPPLPGSTPAPSADEPKDAELSISNGEVTLEAKSPEPKAEADEEKKSSNGVESTPEEKSKEEESPRFRPLQRIRRFFSTAGK